MVGKALRATAINRVGARLMGIPTDLSGDVSFALAALIGAVSGLLIAPLTTVYYDTGFLIGLKGFVAAIVGGLASYPLALLGALLVGQLESFSSFGPVPTKRFGVHTDYSGAVVAFAQQPPCGGRGTARLPHCFAASSATAAPAAADTLAAHGLGRRCWLSPGACCPSSPW